MGDDRIWGRCYGQIGRIKFLSVIISVGEAE